jgi:hypothetical protein
VLPLALLSLSPVSFGMLCFSFLCEDTFQLSLPFGIQKYSYTYEFCVLSSVLYFWFHPTWSDFNILNLLRCVCNLTLCILENDPCTVEKNVYSFDVWGTFCMCILDSFVCSGSHICSFFADFPFNCSIHYDTEISLL